MPNDELMPSGPCERYLEKMREDLQSTFSDEEADRILRELRDHLTESTSEFVAQGMARVQAEQCSVNGFGEQKEISQDLRAGRDARLLTPAETRALIVAGLMTGVPVFGDLAIDASSFMTGSDMSVRGLFLLSVLCIPVLALLFLKVRRVLWMPLTVLCLSTYLFSTVAGGLTRGKTWGNDVTAARGTCRHLAKQSQGYLHSTKGNRFRFNTTRLAFQGSGGFTEPFRDAGGYIVPQDLRQLNRERAGQYTSQTQHFDVLYTREEDRERARRAWVERGALWDQELLQTIESLERNLMWSSMVRDSSWMETVRAQFYLKTTLLVLWTGVLLGLNMLGVLLGGAWNRIRPHGVTR